MNSKSTKTTVKTYTPSKEILDKYADVLVNFALNSGEGVKPGEVVQVAAPDVAKDLLRSLQNAILEAGAHPMIRMFPTGFDADFYELANDSQLKFFPKKYMMARADLIDHQIAIIADVNPRELEKADPEKIIKARDSKKEFRDWLNEKETQGKFTWTIGLWGTEAKATEVGLSYEEYWQQIINACFLDYKDPVAEWRNISNFQKITKEKLNDLRIEYLHIKSEDSDLTVKLGADRVWNAGSGRNIPSFEFFTSPNWRGTNGWIRFNQPLYRYGQIIENIYLEFKEGIVVKATAKKGQKFLDAMLKSPNADKIGEISLTDGRTSRITHVMAETLYDENIGGKEGNTHLAVGMSYKDCYRGDASKLKKADWDKLGFNDSAEHTDIISTARRTVTAILPNGETKVIYKNGQFTL